MAEKVELHHAYFWHCHSCAAENYVRAITVEMTPDDVTEMMHQYGGDASYWATGNWTSRPDDVTCNQCGKSWATEDWQDGDELHEDWPS